MAAYSCLLRGAAEVYTVDHVKERLDKASEIGAIPINYDEADPVQQIKERRNGQGVDKGIDAVGYQATSAGSSAAGGEQDEVPNIVLNQIIEAVNPTGALGIPGLYVPSDPGGVDEAAKRGALSINFGKLFEKGLRLGTGQCNVKQYNAYLRDLIIAGRAKPSFVVSNEVRLDDAPRRLHQVRPARRGVHQGHLASVSVNGEVPSGPSAIHAVHHAPYSTSTRRPVRADS